MKDKFQNPFKSVQLDEYNRYVAGALGAGFGAISGIAHSATLPNHGAELIIPAHITAWSSYFYGKGLKDDIDSAYYRHQKNLQVYGPDHPETQKTKNELKDLSKKIVFFPHILGNLYHRAVSGKWTASGQDYLRELKKKEKESLAENSLLNNPQNEKDKGDPLAGLKLLTTNQRFSRQLAVPIATHIARTPLRLLGISEYIPFIPEIIAAHYAYRTGLKSDLQYRLNKYIENRDLHGEHHPETIKYKNEYNLLAPTLKKVEKQHKWFVNKVKSLAGNVRNRMGRTGKGSTIPFEVSNTPYESKLPVYRG